MFNIDALKENLQKQLDADQRRIATTRTDTGYRRVKGPAGSGKSLTLAARAAVLAFSGKKVLVCSYNITLLGQLSTFVEKFIPPEVAQRITFINFHAWCRDVCRQTGNRRRYDQLWDSKDQGIYTEDAVFGSTEDAVFGFLIPQLVSDIYQTDSQSLPYYDAILVDEGQDFHINWWQTLRQAIVEGGEMLLVADMTQNVHGTAQAWTDKAMLDCGFSGDWGKLKKSYRLPNSIIPILYDFLTRFPCDGEDDLPEVSGQTNLFDKFRWVQVSWGPSVVDTCIGEIERFYNTPDIPTVYFLSGRKIGMHVVSGLKQGDWKSLIHTVRIGVSPTAKR